MSEPADAANLVRGPPAPLSATGGARLASLDFTRGIAVLGILAANIGAFGQPQLAAIWPGASLAPPSAADAWFWLAQFVLVDGKMRGLFTLLFGAGMVLFVEKAWARGATRGLQARRLGWLLLFGLAHFYLLWRGDILAAYALCGLIVLPLVRWDAVRLLAMGLTVYLFGALYYTIAYGASYLAAAGGGGNELLAELHRQTQAYVAAEHADALLEARLIGAGDYIGTVAHGFAAHGREWFTGFVAGWLETVPLMLIGMGLYRAGLFDGRLDPAVQRRWGWIGVAVGLAATLALGLWAMRGGLGLDAVTFVEAGASTFARLPLILGLAALLALWGPRASGRLGARVSAAGRMAFTNYIGTSLAMLFVFHGFGLGWFGRFDRPRLFLVVLVAWAVMLLWSTFWLARFRYGPLEWLWRCLTYGRTFALKR